jgi:hypothetical protein
VVKPGRDAAAEASHAILSVRVTPRSSREEVAGFSGGILRVRLTAPPVEGKANEALLRFLARAAGVPRRSVTLLSGETGRAKRVRVEGLAEEALLRRLGVEVGGER